MPAASVNDLVAMLAAARLRCGFKQSATTDGAGVAHSLWKIEGNPRAGATPATGVGAVPTSATTGAMPHTNAAGGNNARLMRFVGVAGQICQVRLYDRLWANSGLSGSSTGSQPVNSAALTRPDALGNGAELWGEVYTALGSGTSYTISVDYTNPAGTTGRTATFDPAAYASPNTVGAMFPFRLQAGDQGIKSVQSAQLSASSGATGDWGLVILRPIAVLTLDTASTGRELDCFRTALAEILDDACLALQVVPSTTSTGLLFWSTTIGEDVE